MIHSALHEDIKLSRAEVARLRIQFPDPADFDKYVKEAIRGSLERQGFKAQTVAFTLRAIFGD